MYKLVIIISSIIMFTIILSGCITPVSQNCRSSQPFESSNNGAPTKEQNCSELDAAIYLASALYKEAQKNPTKEQATTKPTDKDIKCSDLIGKSQKECLRKQSTSYDPLDEL